MTEVPAELQIEIDKLERKHAENPDGRFFVPLANAYRRAGDGETAERLLRTGVARHPGYLSARIVLGRCLADRGAIAEAEDEFRYVVSEDPQNVVALRTLAELARQEGHIDEAFGWYHELLAVDPQNDEARKALDELQATAQSGEEEQPLAESEAESGDEAEVPLEVVTETIAELYARQGLHDRAAAVYRELIRRKGSEPALERRLRELESAAAVAERGEAPAADPAELETAPAYIEPPSAPAEVEDDGILALEDEEALLTPALDSEVDAFADSFVDGFPGPEPGLTDPPPAREEPTVSIVGFLSRLATWTPGGTAGAAAGAAPEIATGEERWERSLDGDVGIPPADDVLFPWELPVEDAHVTDRAAEPEPVPDEEEDDDDVESFQDWLRSLKQ